MGDTEAAAILCNEAGPQVERLGHQPNPQSSNLQYLLPEECAGVMVAQNL